MATSVWKLGESERERRWEAFSAFVYVYRVRERQLNPPNHSLCRLSWQVSDWLVDSICISLYMGIARWRSDSQKQEELADTLGRSNVAKSVKTYLETLKWEVLPHPPYSSDVIPSNWETGKSRNQRWTILWLICSFISVWNKCIFDNKKTDRINLYSQLKFCRSWVLNFLKVPFFQTKKKIVEKKDIQTVSHEKLVETLSFQ